MATVQELLDKRNRALDEQRTMIDAAITQDRGLSPEEQVRSDKIDTDVNNWDGLYKQLMDNQSRSAERDVMREELEKIAPATPGVQSNRAQEDGFRDFLRGKGPKNEEGMTCYDVDIASAQRARMAIRSGARGHEFRDLMVVNGSTGGTLVPTDFANQLYDFLEVYSGIRKSNATILVTSTGNALDFPVVASHGTAALVGEGSAFAENDPSFGRMRLDSWKYGQLLQMSFELVRDAGVDVVGFAARDMARGIARATDIAYSVGSGSNQPQGIFTKGYGTAVTGANGGTGIPTFDDMIDLIYSVNEEYRSQGEFLMRDATAGKVRKLKDTTGQYMWQPSVIAGQPDRLLNYPVRTTPNAPAMGTGLLSVAFGDFSTFYIRDVGPLRLERSDHFAFANDLVSWRCAFCTDSDGIDINAIRYFRGGTA